MVKTQYSAEPLARANRTFGAIFVLAGREQQYITPTLMIPFVVMVGDVLLQSETKRLLSEEYELRQAFVFR